MQINFFAGLGNQLFQYAFAHNVSLITSNKIKARVLSTNRMDRTFNLESLLSYCTHIDSHSLKTELKGDRTSIFNSWRIVKESCEFEFDFDFVSGLKKRHIIHGYFQNFNYVERVFHFLNPEIMSFLETINVSNIVLPKNFIGIHVRRGDNIYTLDSMGTLNSEYYIEILKYLNIYKLPIIVFTDDLKGAEDVTSRIDCHSLFGPSDLTEWQSLKLMMQSKILVAANSTFSWWAGYLGYKNKKIDKLILPKPWFRNWPTPVENAFYFPNVDIHQSKFITRSKFNTDYRLTF